jgi:cobalt/nickel transport system permease protein
VIRERYEALDSPVHQLDPRVKLVTGLILITGIVLTPDTAWPAYPLLWALVGSLATLARVGAWRVARLGGLALPFALAAATLMFTTPGDPLLNVAGLTITDAGLERFAAILLKSWLAVQVALLLSMTTAFTDLLWALTGLRVPATLVAIIGFMYRYLFTLRDEADRLTRARAARSAELPGYRSGGSLSWRARMAGNMVGNLFLRAYERSERVYAAMLARGYAGQMRRFNPPPLTRGAVFQGAIPVVVLVIIQVLAVLWWKN